MRPVDQIIKFLEIKNLSPRPFEKECNLGNGYLRKQQSGRGTMGSDALEKIHKNYPQLNILWVLFDEGEMEILPENPHTQNAHPSAHPTYPTSYPTAYPTNVSDENETLNERLKMSEKLVEVLTRENAVLSAANTDKQKIIEMQEEKLKTLKSKNKN